MLKDFSVLFVLASVKIATSENLPEVKVPSSQQLLPQNPPHMPRIYLTGQKFALPQFCSNASEWDDVDLSLKVLADYSEPEPERSAFASLINLIKFILIKEELSCIDAMSSSTQNRPEGKINREILDKIESALANKPRQKPPPLEYHDSVDITNMIPIWRPRINNRRKNQATQIEAKSNCTCNVGPKVLQNLGPGSLNPSTSKTGCPCPKRQTLILNVPKHCPKCQTLPCTNIKQSCNCQKLSNSVTGCPKLGVLPVSPARLVVSGCPCSLCGCRDMSGSKVISRPSCADISTCPCQAKQSLTVLQSETVPLVNCFGNVMKQVTTTVLVPYTVSQIVA